MKRFVIERNLSGAGRLTGQQLKEAAAKSNDALARLNGRAQWVQSYVAADKTFCIYFVHEHARLSGFPANKVTETSGIIDPTTAN